MSSLVVEEEHENCSRSAVSYCEMPFADSLHGARQIPYLVLNGLSDWFFFAALQPRKMSLDEFSFVVQRGQVHEFQQNFTLYCR